MARRLFLMALISIASLLHGTPDAPDAPSAEGVAPEVREYLAQLEAKSRELTSIALHFRQEKRLKFLRRPRRSRGELWYSDGRLAMIVRSEKGAVESHLVAADGRLRIFYPALKRLEVMDLRVGGGREAKTTQAIPFLTGDWQKTIDLYAIKMQRQRSGSHELDEAGDDSVTLDLRPRAVDSPLESIRLALKDHRVVEYHQRERGGNEVHLEVVKWQTNVKVSQRRFRLDVPAGTKTVEVGATAKR